MRKSCMKWTVTSCGSIPFGSLTREPTARRCGTRCRRRGHGGVRPAEERNSLGTLKPFSELSLGNGHVGVVIAGAARVPDDGA